MLLLLLVTYVSLAAASIDSEIAVANQYAEENGSPVEFPQSPSGQMTKQELDIMLTPEQSVNMYESGDSTRRKRNFQKYVKRWPGGVVVYQYGSRFPRSNAVRNAVKTAFNTISASTCVTFRERTGSDRNYITIVESGGCWSSVGMSGGQQQLSLGRGCKSVATIMHEFIHALGFLHEQSRPDRDNYVTIYYGSVNPSMRYNFDKARASGWDSFGSAYDYRSIMHYGQYAFSNAYGRAITIKTKDPNFQRIIGETKQLTTDDITQINKAYSCKGKKVKPTTITTTTEVGKKVVGFKRQQGYIVAGNNLKIITNTNEARCTASCKVESRCKCITFNVSNPARCHLKTVCAFEPHSAWISLIKTTTSGGKTTTTKTKKTFKKKRGYISAGNDISKTRKSEAGCLSACKANSRCRCATQNRASGVCYLKTRCVFTSHSAWISWV